MGLDILTLIRFHNLPALGRDLSGLSLAQWISIPGPILGVCHPLLLESPVPQGLLQGSLERQKYSGAEFLLLFTVIDCKSR